MKKEVLRRCIITGERLNKNALLRVVKTPSGEIKIHTSGRLDGRGAYLKRDRAVILKAKKRNALSHALLAPVNDEIYEELLKLAS